MKIPALRNLLALCFLTISLIFSPWMAAYAQNDCNVVSTSTTTGDIAATDTAQTSRLFRDGRGTTCTFNRPQTTSAGTFRSDQYPFTNTTGGPICVYVDLNALGCGVATNQVSIAAYNGSYNPASILTNVIADPGLSTGMNFATSMNFTVATGATYVIVVHNINAGTSCVSYSFRQTITNGCRAAGYDAANDGSADLAVFRPSGGLANWHSMTLAGGVTNTQFGSAGDIPVAADYSGDEATDVGVFRPSNGTWYTSSNPGTNYGAQAWGISGDVPVHGDYDRDGITDIAVFRPSNNTYYVLRSSNGTLLQQAMGVSGDKPVPADYDADGKMDFGVFRPSNGLWTTLGSAGNYGSNANQQIFGVSTDIPVPADYDGDSKADLAVYRPSNGTWYIFRSSLTAGQVQYINFGIAGDLPQPADYDGDKKADAAVFRPSDNTWHILKSTGGTEIRTFGSTGDLPVSAPNANTNQ